VIKACTQYGKDEVAPRARRIILSSSTVLALAAAWAVERFGPEAGLATAKSGNLANALLTYSAIAFGFCLSGMTLALTLPDKDFGNELAQSRRGPNDPDAYSDLLFVFSWTAVCHWVTVAIGFVATIALPADQEVLPVGASDVRRAVVSTLVAITVYVVSQFLITVITLSQVGRLYIVVLNRRRTAQGQPQGTSPSPQAPSGPRAP
jgi:hypothetical protein